MIKNTFYDFSLFFLPDMDVFFRRLEGNNQHYFFIIYQKENEAQDKSNLILLDKMLAALKLDRQNDVLCLKLDLDENIDFSAIQKRFNIKTVLFFGIDPKKTGVNFQIAPYQWLKTDKIQILKADALSTIDANRNLKVALWNCLQQR